MSYRLGATMAVAMAIVLVAVGCGSSGGGEGDSASGSGSAEAVSSSPEQAEFVKQANAACLKEREDTLTQVGVYKNKYSSEGLSEEALTRKAIKTAILQTLEEEINALQELQPPEGDEEKVEAMLAAQQATFEEAKKQQAKLSTAAIEASFADSDEDLRAYGLTSCTKSR